MKNNYPDKCFKKKYGCNSFEIDQTESLVIPSLSLYYRVFSLMTKSDLFFRWQTHFRNDFEEEKVELNYFEIGQTGALVIPYLAVYF
jgi:hypothetical protein